MREVGLFDYPIVLIGEANHAGTTAMHRRKDAMAAGRLSEEITRSVEILEKILRKLTEK